jgi:hypothetical protein
MPVARRNFLFILIYNVIKPFAAFFLPSLLSNEIARFFTLKAFRRKLFEILGFSSFEVWFKIKNLLDRCTVSKSKDEKLLFLQ